MRLAGRRQPMTGVGSVLFSLLPALISLVMALMATRLFCASKPTSFCRQSRTSIRTEASPGQAGKRWHLGDLALQWSIILVLISQHPALDQLWHGCNPRLFPSAAEGGRTCWSGSPTYPSPSRLQGLQSKGRPSEQQLWWDQPGRRWLA